MTGDGTAVRTRRGESPATEEGDAAAESGHSDERDASDKSAIPELTGGAGTHTVARFAEPRTGTPTTLAVFSDPHLSTEEEGTWKVFHRTGERLRAAVADANDRGVDGVLLTGDLTENGHPRDFDATADVLADLDAPAVAVPGNHDVPKEFKDYETPPVSEFADRFAPDEFPFRTRLGGVDVLGLNSASAPGGDLAATHDGAISDDQLSWLESTLPETDAALVLSHHNLPGLESCLSEDHDYAPHPPVGDAPAFVDALAGSSALHLSGHVHLPVAISGDVRGLISPAVALVPRLGDCLCALGKSLGDRALVPSAVTDVVGDVAPNDVSGLLGVVADGGGDVGCHVDGLLAPGRFHLLADVRETVV
jgi:predicted MPP superfamily phosphohydrolase